MADMGDTLIKIKYLRFSYGQNLVLKGTVQGAYIKGASRSFSMMYSPGRRKLATSSASASSSPLPWTPSMYAWVSATNSLDFALSTPYRPLPTGAKTTGAASDDR